MVFVFSNSKQHEIQSKLLLHKNQVSKCFSIISELNPIHQHQHDIQNKLLLKNFKFPSASQSSLKQSKLTLTISQNLQFSSRFLQVVMISNPKQELQILQFSSRFLQDFVISSPKQKLQNLQFSSRVLQVFVFSNSKQHETQSKLLLHKNQVSKCFSIISVVMISNPKQESQNLQFSSRFLQVL